MRRSFLVILALLAAFGLAASADTGGAKNAKAKPRVVFVTVDGLRGDLAATMSFFKGMQRDGAWTFTAKAPHPQITVVSHAVIFTGVEPKKNGVTTFEPAEKKLAAWRPLKAKTIFETADAAGLATAAFVEKHKLDGLLPVEAIGAYKYYKTSKEETDGFCAALDGDKTIDLAFIHLAEVDAAGHAHGWMSDEQKKAADGLDDRLVEIRGCLDENEAATGRQTILIVTADHGGEGKTHGKDRPEDIEVPWAAVGPGIAQGVELKNVRLEDTAAAVADLLGLSASGLDGTVPTGLRAP